MSAELIEQKGNEATIQFTAEPTGQTLRDEQALQQSLDDAGQVASLERIAISRSGTALVKASLATKNVRAGRR